jgi:hypothetical protein
MTIDRLLERHDRLAADANAQREAVDHYEWQSGYYASRLARSKKLLDEINAEAKSLQFELLLRLPYRRFCKLFNI